MDGVSLGGPSPPPFPSFLLSPVHNHTSSNHLVGKPSKSRLWKVAIVASCGSGSGKLTFVRREPENEVKKRKKCFLELELFCFGVLKQCSRFRSLSRDGSRPLVI